MRNCVCTFLAAFAMIPCGLQAATIGITDVPGADPSVVITLPNKLVLPADELVNITGTLNSTTGTIPAGTHSVLFTEPGFPNVYTDYATLIASPVILHTRVIADLAMKKNLTITIQSPLDAPEPGSNVLLGTGLLAFGFLRIKPAPRGFSPH